MELPEVKKAREPMQKALDKLKEEFRTLHTGRAQSSLVENILVDYYGTKTPLKQMAQITTPAANLIIILPWDKNSLGDIENGIRNSDLNLNPINDGRSIKLNLPPLTQERRKELSKVIHTKAEETRVMIRNLRHQIWEEVQNKVRQGELTEDDKYSIKDGLQKVISEYEGEIEKLVLDKEKEIMTI